MSTSNAPDTGQTKGTDIPGWLALVIAVIFGVILLTLVHAGIPWTFSRLLPRYGWIEGRPSPWNMLGLLPIVFATIILVCL